MVNTSAISAIQLVSSLVKSIPTNRIQVPEQLSLKKENQIKDARTLGRCKKDLIAPLLGRYNETH